MIKRSLIIASFWIILPIALLKLALGTKLTSLFYLIYFTFYCKKPTVICQMTKKNKEVLRNVPGIYNRFYPFILTLFGSFQSFADRFRCKKSEADEVILIKFEDGGEVVLDIYSKEYSEVKDKKIKLNEFDDETEINLLSSENSDEEKEASKDNLNLKNKTNEKYDLENGNTYENEFFHDFDDKIKTTDKIYENNNTGNINLIGINNIDKYKNYTEESNYNSNIEDKNNIFDIKDKNIGSSLEDKESTDDILFSRLIDLTGLKRNIHINLYKNLKKSFESKYKNFLKEIRNKSYKKSNKNFIEDDRTFSKKIMNKSYEQSETTDSIILVHGFNSSSDSNYIRILASHLRENGFRVFAFNSRGTKINLKTPVFYHIGWTNDLKDVLDYVLEKYPGNVSLIGFSLGGNWVLKFLGEDRFTSNMTYKSRVVGGMAVSTPFDFTKINVHFSKKNFNVLINRFMANKYKNFLKRNESALKKANIDMDQIKKYNSIVEIDHILLKTIFNISDMSKHHKESSCITHIPKIEKQVMIINSKDDPIVPINTIDIETCLGNKNVILVLTEKGGHLGFIDYSCDKNYFENIAVDYINYIHRIFKNK